MASVRTIAQKAGVSITTVSRVLNNHPQVSADVRKRVLTASNETGYTPIVGRRSTSNIAFVYTGESSIGSPFDAAILVGLCRRMEDHRLDLVVIDARRARATGETYTQMFLRKGIRGAVLRTTLQTHIVCETIAAEGFPCVVVGDRLDHDSVSYVYGDSREASRDATEHLIGLGHRRISICINIVDDSDHVDRLSGYRQALADHQIAFDNKLVLRVPANRDGGAQLLRRLMTMVDRPTAAFLTDPMTAVGLLSEARKSNIRIPEDLSIVGFDDTETRYSVFPELTAVCQDAAGLGRESFEALLAIMNQTDEKVVVRKSLRTWLEVHGSTAAPRS
jgi:DNA-binding LacI/PurR family transcriptional regulator